MKCLVAAQAPYKAKLAAEKEEARRKAEAEAAAKAEAARQAHLAANAASIEEQRKADELMAAAEEAQKAAARAAKDTVKGMRTVQRYEIQSHKDALNWIARNDRDALTVFIEEYVRRNFKVRAIDGVTVETVKEAFYWPSLPGSTARATGRTLGSAPPVIEHGSADTAVRPAGA